MNNDNDFEIIDDFDDISIESSSNPAVSNEVPFNEKINTNLQVEPNFTFEENKTAMPIKDNPSSIEPLNQIANDEPITFEFDGFEGVLNEEENISTQSSPQPATPLEVETDNSKTAAPQMKEETAPLGQPEKPLAAPGTVNVMPTTPTLNMDVKPVPTVEENNEQPVEINPVLPNGNPVVTTKETKETEFNSNDKKGKNTTKLMFIVLLFAIIGAVIIFLPQISSMLKK